MFHPRKYDQPELLSDDALMETLAFCDRQMRSSKQQMERAEASGNVDAIVSAALTVGVDTKDFLRVNAEFERRTA